MVILNSLKRTMEQPCAALEELDYCLVELDTSEL